MKAPAIFWTVQFWIITICSTPSTTHPVTKFQSYYKDLSLRMKNKEVDLLIVVNMFLTGFDATTLNTLWADKNLKMHGLIQAFSRTNRILNSIKTFGNIVCFRNLQKRVDDAISLFAIRMPLASYYYKVSMLLPRL